MAVANQYEVGRCDVSLVHNSGPCICHSACIRFSLKMKNKKCDMNIHYHFTGAMLANDSMHNVTIDLLQFRIKLQCKIEITTF